MTLVEIIIVVITFCVFVPLLYRMVKLLEKRLNINEAKREGYLIIPPDVIKGLGTFIFSEAAKISKTPRIYNGPTDLIGKGGYLPTHPILKLSNRLKELLQEQDLYDKYFIDEGRE